MDYIIGDVHGEISKLKKLINLIKSIDLQPKFIFIGDYIDKGENPKATLHYLTDLKNQYECKFLMGNHEYCWLDAENHESYLLKFGGLNTINSFGCHTIFETQKSMLKQFNAFFNELIDYYIIDNYFISHSGMPPEFYFEKNIDNLDQKTFLFNRYPFITQQSLFQGKYKVIFGHTGFYSPYVDDYKIGIDTAACFLEEQPLTAYCINTATFTNSNLEVLNIEQIKKGYCPNILRNKPWRLNL